jgi:uncharacterized protein
MAANAELLELIHRIHRQLADLRDRQQRGPLQVKARETNAAKIEAELTAAQDAVKQTKVISDRKQLDLKANEQRIAEWKVKLNACSNNKEYQTMIDQIAAAEMAGSVLADEILETMEKSDQLELVVAEVKTRVAAAKNEVTKFRDMVAGEAQNIAADIARLDSELTEAEKQLPTEFREEYRRVIRGKGADGMAKMEAGVCEGCGKQVTLNMQNHLMLGKPVFCTACGRLLYTAER